MKNVPRKVTYERLAAGLCVQCDAPRVMGKTKCARHYRLQQMRIAARANEKSVPDAGLLESMVPPDMACPACARTMNWLARDGRSTVISLQHDRDGTIRLICMGCNDRHQHYEGDSFYSAPKDKKLCRSCGDWLPLADFYSRMNRRPGGSRISECKRCSCARQVQYRTDPEGHAADLARQRKRYADNRIEINARQRDRHADNPTINREYQRARRAARTPEQREEQNARRRKTAR